MPKNREEQKSNSTKDLILSLLGFLLIIVGYGLRKWIEKPTFLKFQNPSEYLSSSWLWAIYCLGIILIIVGFVFLLEFPVSYCFNFFIGKFKNSRFAIELQEFKTIAYYNTIGGALSKKAILRYSKNRIFSFQLIEYYRTQSQLVILAIFIIVSYMIFFILKISVYDNLLTFETLKVFEIKGEPFPFRIFWLKTVWGVNKLLNWSVIILGLVFLPKIWKFYYDTVIMNLDDLNYEYFKAEHAMETGNYKLAIKYYKTLISKSADWGGLNLGDSPRQNIYKEYFKKKIKTAEEHLL